MNREWAIAQLDARGAPWDLIVIGGGATGLGVALDAASRGYRTLLLEAHDFAKATSSRSTKLIHGGVRYLKQGNLSLVREALRERGLLLRNAPDLVHPLNFVIPVSSWFEKCFYGVGLTCYDALSGSLSLGATCWLNREQTLREVPNLNATGLAGGIRYVDGQFDDAGLAIRLARAIFLHSGVALNYFPVRSLLKQNGRTVGVIAEDAETGQSYELSARAVINATGVFSDAIRRMDVPGAAASLSFSQGAHVVLDRSFLPGGTALMIPKTKDGRVLFAIPWQGHTLVGTTDTPVHEALLEPRPLAEEIRFLLEHAGELLQRKPVTADVRSCFAGVRPLLKAAPGVATAKLSREHGLTVSDSGLVSISGGKWTSYRFMAEETVDCAARQGALEARSCRTRDLPLRAAEWIPTESALDGPLHPRLPYRVFDVLRSIEVEMARTLEDVLSRRTRALFLDVGASLEMAEPVAEILRSRLVKTEAWKQDQVATFRALARQYLP
ncbi:MAG: glycerol-3-phosphate dehydrogenase/oxidase [Verrucomicrobiales bacterium]|nr:glycerol-3-phosphate dehydrogenase/oxidase [Verrucomicrobiales bacterium]